MNILFVCGCLESGRDGVGDHVRRLSWQINQLGHFSSIVAVNDKYTTELITTDDFESGIITQITRVPSVWNQNRRFKILASLIEKYSPDWISLHYVPYSYHPLGTPLTLGYRLKPIGKKAKWQVMIHEPYLSFPQFGVKNKIIQFLQIKSLQLLKKSLKPHLVHTSNSHYQYMLSQIGLETDLLGLFGNIQVAETKAIKRSPDSDMAVYFGAAPPKHDQIILVKKLVDFYSQHNKKLNLIFCGRLGPLGKDFAEEVKTHTANTLIKLTELGEVDAEKISELFQTADFGICRVPARLIGKSGTAISMLEHGLPLWIPISEKENDFNYLDFRKELCFKSLTELPNINNTKASIERLPLIASQLIGSFLGY